MRLPHVAILILLLRPHTISAQFNIPSCALQCFTTALDTDGCSSETDFECHCKKSSFTSSVLSCSQGSCNTNDQKKASQSLFNGCKAVGVSITLSIARSTTLVTSTSSPPPSSQPAAATTSSAASSSTSSASPPSTSALDAPSPSSQPTSQAQSDSQSQPQTSTRLPLDTPPTSSTAPSTISSSTPLAINSTASQTLSSGAKIGIALSIALFFALIIALILIYIQRLKRDLAAARAAAGVPESEWRNSIVTATAVGTADVGRRKSWRGSLRRHSAPAWGYGAEAGERGERRRSMVDKGDGGFGAGGGSHRRGRSGVLSVVMERYDEDGTSTLRRSRSQDSIESHEAFVRQPVIGQREGLVGALEIDGREVVVSELPTTITPRVERTQEDVERGMRGLGPLPLGRSTEEALQMRAARMERVMSLSREIARERGLSEQSRDSLDKEMR